MNATSPMKTAANFQKGQRVQIRPEFCTPEEASIIHLVTESSPERTSITPAPGQGFDEMRIKPVERVETHMLEVAL